MPHGKAKRIPSASSDSSRNELKHVGHPVELSPVDPDRIPSVTAVTASPSRVRQERL